MYYDFTIGIPDVPGKIVLKKKGDAVYVQYEYDRVYDAGRKFNIPKRAIIGKVCREDSSLMHPNEKYQEYFPFAVLPEERPDSYRSCCLRICESQAKTTIFRKIIFTIPRKIIFTI